MAEQAENPNLLSWQRLATSEKALDNACCCAIILANLIEYDYHEQSHKLFQISEQVKDITTGELNTQYGSVSYGERTLKCRKPYPSLGLRTLIEKSLNCIP